MNLVIRILIYAVVMFLIMIVYTGQQHDNAKDILADSVRKCGRFMWWSLVLVLVMELCVWLFIE